MKKMIKAASINERDAMNAAKRVLKAGKDLLNVLEDAPEGFIEANDLTTVYDELFDVLPALDFAINSNAVPSGSPSGQIPDEFFE